MARKAMASSPTSSLREAIAIGEKSPAPTRRAAAAIARSGSDMPRARASVASTAATTPIRRTSACRCSISRSGASADGNEPWSIAIAPSSARGARLMTRVIVSSPNSALPSLPVVAYRLAPRSRASSILDPSGSVLARACHSPSSGRLRNVTSSPVKLRISCAIASSIRIPATIQAMGWGARSGTTTSW